MGKLYITWEQVFDRLSQIEKQYPGRIFYGIPKGGMIATGFLSDKQYQTNIPELADIFLDDLIDSRNTLRHYEKLYPTTEFIALFDKQLEPWLRGQWLVMPWEAQHPGKEDTVEQNIVRSLQYLGEDVNREGLVDTPKRVVKSWKELYKGYLQKPEDILTTFTADGYDQIVLLKDIEIFSMCEHHMLPFFGKAHVAYIPGDKVIGISKLARLVDIYARRLQIQERIGDQVTSALMQYLKPKGAACFIEAVHMCMRMRGVEKQESIMSTSSMKGAFLSNQSARMELMSMIK